MSIKNYLSLILGAAIFVSYHPLVAIAIEVKRDYEYKVPLPQTGQVTIRKALQNLPTEILFESCPSQSYLQDFAESTNFLVMICRDRQNALQKYWIQKNKTTGKILRLTAQDRPNSQPSLWESGDYQVYLYADGIGRGNAYLESYNQKAEKIMSEALLYHYSEFYGSR